MIQRRSSAATKTPAAKKKSKRKNKRQTLALGGPQKSTLHTAVDNRPSLPSLAQLNNEGSNISALEDGQCLAWSANLKFVPERMGNLHACVQGLKRRPDIIAIQDPPLDFPFIAFPGYSRWYRADDEKKKEVTEEDKSTYRPYRFRYSRDPIPEKKEPTKLAKVAFLIHEALNGWSVSQPEDENRGIVATLHLETRDGSSIAFHNVYNHEKRLDVEALTEPCLDETKAHVLLGDFNLHHPLWGGGQLKRRNIEAKAKLLVEKVNDVNMICLNEPGIVTFSRGTQSGGKDTSVVDLVFVSEVITDQVQYKLLDKVKGFESDHRISTVAINLKMERKTGIRYVWRLTPEKKFQKLVAKELEKIDLPHLPDEHRTVEILDAVINKVLVPAIQEFVPVVQVYEPEVKVNVQPSYSTDRTVRTKKWRQAVKIMARSRRGIFHLAKRAQKWGMPKRLAYTPDFQYLTNTYRSNSDKADCFVMATWTKARKKSLPRKSVPTASPDDETSTDTDDQQNSWFSTNIPPLSATKPDFPLPALDPTRPQHYSPDLFTIEEVNQLLSDLPSHKAFGIDGVPYEALKMCREVLAPYMLYIFNALIRLRLHPGHFKDTITLVIKKLGKSPELPNSYRPIAILNCFGKAYERLITDRLKAVVMEHDLLPSTQFGAPGRSTTLALEHVVNTIHGGWLRNKKVTLLGLDLSGAYDHIDRTQLLERLISKGIPDWLVKVVWSFLSDRRTFINMPGYEGGEYWIDVGIPQGSPLSPLLFLFYAAPILTDFLGQYASHEVMMFSFVDDTYILIATDSYSENCEKATRIHEKLDTWAQANNLHFSPTKYHVMHFVRPYEKKSDDTIDLLPDIPEFRNITVKEKEKILPDTLVILGIRFDKRLTWLPHVQEIRTKIQKHLGTFSRFNGSTWGADFVQRRRLYHGKILATISYAAAAWFIHDPTRTPEEGRLRFGLSQKTLEVLESLQAEILLALTRAWKRTAREIMENEMHVLPIVLKLHELAMSHRCQQFNSPEYKKMELMRQNGNIRQRIKNKHPYHQLRMLAENHLQWIYRREQRCYDVETFERLWSSPKKRKIWIKECTAQNAMNQACFVWELYQRNRAFDGKIFHIAHEGSFIDHTLIFYYQLDPVQSTMLIGMRTGNLGLNTNTLYRYSTGITDPKCPLCKQHLHTAEHLLCHCKALSMERTYLREAARHNNFRAFVTVDSELATAWAIRYFGLDQFKNVKDKKKYCFPRKRTHTFSGELV